MCGKKKIHIFGGPRLSEACGFSCLQGQPHTVSAFSFQSQKHTKATMRLVVKWFLSDLHINISQTVDLAQSSLRAPCKGSLLHTLPCDAVRAGHGRLAETTQSMLNLSVQDISFYFLKFQFWNLNPNTVMEIVFFYRLIIGYVVYWPWIYSGLSSWKGNWRIKVSIN